MVHKIHSQHGIAGCNSIEHVTFTDMVANNMLKDSEMLHSVREMTDDLLYHKTDFCGCLDSIAE
jgi:hypothetical protein